MQMNFADLSESACRIPQQHPRALHVQIPYDRFRFHRRRFYGFDAAESQFADFVFDRRVALAFAAD